LEDNKVVKKAINNKRKRTPVWLQVLIVAITLIAVAMVVFLGSQTYRETRKMATEQFNQQQLILARSTATGIETYINRNCPASSRWTLNVCNEGKSGQRKIENRENRVKSRKSGLLLALNELHSQSFHPISKLSIINHLCFYSIQNASNRAVFFKTKVPAYLFKFFSP
jgi:hypothetical protein